MARSRHSRIRVGLIFGGRSAEHDISRISALNIWRHLDPAKFEVVPIAITREGRWLLQDNAKLLESTKNALPVYQNTPEVISLSHADSGMLVSQTRGPAPYRDTGSQLATRNSKIDVIFPILHGPNGEDGTIQGMLELSGIAYVGCGVFASAAGMDKDVARRLVAAKGIPVTPWRTIQWWEPVKSRESMKNFYEKLTKEIRRDFGWPVFVKPARLGSSVGISKVKKAKDLRSACEQAFRYDDKILIEKAVINPREIEVAVLGDSEELLVAQPGEIHAKHDFYSYQAKYLDPNGADFKIPADLSPVQTKRVQEMARQSFLALGGEGLARVDFLMDPQTGKFYFNEVNTMPGFTSISMYPKMMEAMGLSLPKLLEKLIKLALKRQSRRDRFQVK